MSNIEQQFQVLSTEELMNVEGGGKKDNHLGCILGTAGMAGVGFLVAGPQGAAVLGGATAIRVCR